jgi:hypothetical protein
MRTFVLLRLVGLKWQGANAELIEGGGTSESE